MRMLPLLLLSARCCAIASGSPHPAPAPAPVATHESVAADSAHGDPASAPPGHRDPASPHPAHADSAKTPAGHGQKAGPKQAERKDEARSGPHTDKPGKAAEEKGSREGGGKHGSAHGAGAEASGVKGEGAQDAHAQGAHAQDAHAQDAHAQDAHAQDAHAQGAHAKDAHAQGAHAKETSAPKHREEAPERESGEVPSLRPHPDTAFARAADWEHGEAEILEYSVTRSGRDGEGRYRGRLVTERVFLHGDGTTARSGAAGDAGILNASLSVSGEAGGIPSSSVTVSQFPRAGMFALLRQEQSLQGWPGVTHRSLDCRPTPPRLRVASSGGETPRDTSLARWPVYTQEMLFTYLRAIPLRAGYREETWLQDWGEEGRMGIKPHYAAIAVREHAPGIRDMDTWYVTVDREDGRRSEFWIGSAGLHPVVVARLADGSEWALQGISRRKYRSW